MTLLRSFALVVFISIYASASAQILPIAVPSQVDPTGRSGQPPTLPKEFEAPAQPPGTLLPPTPIPPQATPFPGLRVFVREIRVIGSTVFSPGDLAMVTDPYINRELTSEDL
jgi:hemolysin activation/secretion protein